MSMMMLSKRKPHPLLSFDRWIFFFGIVSLLVWILRIILAIVFHEKPDFTFENVFQSDNGISFLEFVDFLDTGSSLQSSWCPTIVCALACAGGMLLRSGTCDQQSIKMTRLSLGTMQVITCCLDTLLGGWLFANPKTFAQLIGCAFVLILCCSVYYSAVAMISCSSQPCEQWTNIFSKSYNTSSLTVCMQTLVQCMFICNEQINTFFM